MKFGHVVFGLLCAASGDAFAESERHRIAVERGVANAKLAQAQRECAVRFIVSACIDEARTAHRETSQRLRQQKLHLDDVARRAVAEERLKSVAERAQFQQPRSSETPPDSPKVRVRRAVPAVLNVDSGAAEDTVSRAISKVASGGSRTAVEQAQQRKFYARTREAEAHRATVAQRNALRAARGKDAAPLQLPVPPTSTPG